MPMASMVRATRGLAASTVVMTVRRVGAVASIACTVGVAACVPTSPGTGETGTGGASDAPYPDASVQYIIPFAPGGESDIAARLQQPFFKEKFGQDLVVSYKTGGGGAVGWSQLNALRDDGYTIMGINLPHIVIQPLQGNVGYATDDVAAVHFFHYTPDTLLVRHDSPFQTVDELVAHARANPGRVTLSGSGKGSANHIAQIRFDGLAAIETSYVAFRGTGAAITALLGAQVAGQWGYTSAGVTYGDRVRSLAVAMEARHPKLPDVPTFRELGYDLVSGAYRGVGVPDSTDEVTRQRISDVIAEINGDPAFVERMENGGFALIDVPYDRMAAFMTQKRAEYEAAAKAAGLAPSLEPEG